MFGPGRTVNGTSANATSGGYSYPGYGDPPSATWRAAGSMNDLEVEPEVSPVVRQIEERDEHQNGQGDEEQAVDEESDEPPRVRDRLNLHSRIVRADPDGIADAIARDRRARFARLDVVPTDGTTRG